MRLDKELVNRALVPTRAKAQELIKSGNVKVNGQVNVKASFDVSNDDIIEIVDTSTLKYVSRAGLKLEKAIKLNKKILDENAFIDMLNS